MTQAANVASSTLPTWTTATRPSSPTAGQMGYNSSLLQMEWYNPGAGGWIAFNAAGGITASYFAIGGGSGGAGETGQSAFGGGGAGGVSASSTLSLIPGTVYTITVGGGGASAVNNTSSPGTNSTITGSNITTVTATPGNGCTTLQVGASNALYSGGGAPSAPNSGGGAGAAGNGSSNGNGGAAIASTITGSTQYYGGGGAGYAGTAGTGGGAYAGGAGTANTGSGGGCGVNSGNLGGQGGSGVVILSIPTAVYSGTYTGASVVVTTSGSNKIITFNSSGTYTA